MPDKRRAGCHMQDSALAFFHVHFKCKFVAMLLTQ